jgi:hypothetical protein
MYLKIGLKFHFKEKYFFYLEIKYKNQFKFGYKIQKIDYKEKKCN